MRLTNKLYAQHLGWMFKKHWHVQRRRTPRDTGALAELEKLGIEVKNPRHFVKTKFEIEPFEVIGSKPIIQAEDETHPNWHAKACCVYGNENVLLEGMQQTQILINTLEINGFPKKITDALEKSQLPSTIDRRVQNAILSANVYDAEQVLLPKRKLADRPTINLPRDYGISKARKIRLTLNKLLAECERLAGNAQTTRRKIVDNANFQVTLPRAEDLLQFNVKCEKLMTSNRPLEAIKGSYDGAIPDLYPMKCTITIPKSNIYSEETIYPFGALNGYSHPHTLFLSFDPEHVKHLHGSKVTSTQLQSRTLLKAFGVAASRAHQLYGNKVMKKLDKPIVVQSIQTDGRVFHFGVFQLNTLSLDDHENVKNYWFHQNEMELFNECLYKEGKPMLSGYNKDVFRYLNAFYNNN